MALLHAALMQSLDARAILEERRKAREAKSAPALQPITQPDPPATDPMVRV